MILEETELNCVICDEKNCLKLVKIKEENPNLKLNTLILFDNPTPDTIEMLNKLGIAFYVYQYLVIQGRNHSFIPVPPHRDDAAMIIYTSGTDMKPKGVILTHNNIASSTQSLMHFHRLGKVSPGDFMLSYLPMGHIFEQMCQANFLSSGGAIGFFTDKSHLLEDLKLLEPTVFATVPRLLIKMRQQLLLQIKSKGIVLQKIYNYFYKIKQENLAEFNVLQLKYADTLFNKVYKLLTE